MRLFERIVADIRGPESTDKDAVNMVNEKLQMLQTTNDGFRNPNVTILDVHKENNDSGILTFAVLYEDKGLDVLPPKE